MNVWLAQNPVDGRITTQDRAFTVVDFPPGAQGLGWEQRDLDVPAETWTRLLQAAFSPDEQDELHRAWWEQAAPPDTEGT